MSGRYVSRVLESDLPPHLSKTAEALATFADEDGRRIKPSMPYLAWLTKQSVRTVQNHMAVLRRLEILVELSPATQHRPAHYRMVLENLPLRPPFRLPEVQLPAPLDGPPEVQPAAPLAPRGATSASRGATAVAPDPSIDPYVQTHTPRAREAPALPLVGPVPPPRCPHPHAHAWCEGRVHVPRNLHFEFLDRLDTRPGESTAQKAGRLVAFYADAMRRLPATQAVPDPYLFWKAAYVAWVTAAAAVAAPIRACRGQHDPPCARDYLCIERTIAEGRAARERRQA
jgi:hypothetical protein